MDQLQIGKFIAEARKTQRLTQKQLANQLRISDKTISKWECGKGLPEVSLMLPLCKTLDITVNDLLSGERVSEGNYQRKAEENMMYLIKEKEENKKKNVAVHYLWHDNNHRGLRAHHDSLIYRIIYRYTDYIGCIGRSNSGGRDRSRRHAGC